MAFVTLVVTSGSAYAIDVDEEIAVLGQMIVIWSMASGFAR